MRLAEENLLSGLDFTEVFSRREGRNENATKALLTGQEDYFTQRG
jgi:hypothetical protein